MRLGETTFPPPGVISYRRRSIYVRMQRKHQGAAPRCPSLTYALTNELRFNDHTDLIGAISR